VSENGHRTEPRERITRVVEGWFLTEPLLFAAWTMHEIVSQSNLATIRVGRGKIEFNPKFVDSLRNEELREVLTFETMRILLGHPYSRRQANAELSYSASNLSVQECVRSKLPIPRARDLLGGDQYDHQYFEFYYRELSERQTEDHSDDPDTPDGANASDNSGPSQQPSSTGEPESEQPESEEPEPTKPENQSASAEQPDRDDASNEENPHNEDSDNAEDSNDDDSSETDTDSEGEPSTGLESYADPASVGEQNTEAWDSDDLLQEEISVAIQEAAEGDGWGTLGGHAREQLKATLKPPLDYRGVLRQFRQSVLSVNRKLTRMKPSRRYGFDQMGSRYDFTTQLLFAVDVSGSMSREDLQLGFSVVNRFFQYGVRSVDVVWFDTEIIAPPVTFRRAKHDIEITGRGGTNFQCLMDLIDGQSQHARPSIYDGLIVFTDGQAPVPPTPSNRQTKILWLFHTQAAHERMGANLSKLGATAFLKPAKAAMS
jgi:predicted metal-dependent peptidase